MTEKRYYQGTGRRKTAVARVRLFPGEGKIVINGKAPEDYFGPRELFQRQIRTPLELVGSLGAYNVMVKVRGGGVAGQVGAVRHGIARALLDVDPDNRAVLKRTKTDAGSLLTRDPRVKERKKVGLKRARKAPQYTKR